MAKGFRDARINGRGDGGPVEFRGDIRHLGLGDAGEQVGRRALLGGLELRLYIGKGVVRHGVPL
ncbi:hypothetical protein ACWGE0_02935 [Lentzea sp. NPDC054927]